MTHFDILAPSHLEIDLLDECAVASFLKSKNADIVINATDITLTTEGHFEKRVRMYKNVAKYNAYYDKMIFSTQVLSMDEHYSYKISRKSSSIVLSPWVPMDSVFIK